MEMEVVRGKGGGGEGRFTPTNMPILTRPGSFRLPALRPQSMRAFSSVATSRAWKGMRLALRMVSRREVAVVMWEEPAVREV